MECQRIRENISAYIDDELLPEEKTAFNEHLLQCKACREEYRATLLLSQDISALPLRETERDFSKEWKSFIESEQKASLHHHSKVHPKRRAKYRFMKGMAAIAACFLLISVAAVAGFGLPFHNEPSVSDEGSTYQEQRNDNRQVVSTYEKDSPRDHATEASDSGGESGGNDEVGNDENSGSLPDEVTTLSGSDTESILDPQDGIAELILTTENTEALLDFLTEIPAEAVEVFDNETIKCLVPANDFSKFLESLYTEKYLSSEDYERLSSLDLTETDFHEITCILMINH